MTSGWESVALGEVVRPTERREAPISGKAYRQVGVKLWGLGAYERETIDGSATKYPTLARVETNDLVVNKIWARNGSVAVITPQLAGAWVSNEFPTFAPLEHRVLSRWLHWITKSKWFWDACNSQSQGTSGQNRIRPEKFLEILISLPPLEEQRRIVARVEALATRIEEARGLRAQTLEIAKTFSSASVKHVFDRLDGDHVPLGKLVITKGGGTPSKAEPSFWIGDIPWITPKDMKVREIYDSRDHISESATVGSSAKMLEPNAVLVVVRGMILAHTLPVAILRSPATINQDMKALIPDKRVSPEFLSAYLWARNREILSLVEKSSHDTRKLETHKLLAFPVPIPDLETQFAVLEEINDLERKTTDLERLQTSTRLELDALLPSVLAKAFAGEL